MHFHFVITMTLSYGPGNLQFKHGIPSIFERFPSLLNVLSTKREKKSFLKL